MFAFSLNVSANKIINYILKDHSVLL